jgi:hypothetical protein
MFVGVSLQELKVFLETSGELGSNMRWTGMMPASASVLEGTAKFSMQLIGRESKVCIRVILQECRQ